MRHMQICSSVCLQNIARANLKIFHLWIKKTLRQKVFASKACMSLIILTFSGRLSNHQWIIISCQLSSFAENPSIFSYISLMAWTVIHSSKIFLGGNVHQIDSLWVILDLMVLRWSSYYICLYAIFWLCIFWYLLSLDYCLLGRLVRARASHELWKFMRI